MSSVIRILKDKSGVAFPLVAAITLTMLMLICAISEYVRLNIIATGVREALQSAIISAVNDNYDDVYHSVREGYAAGYQPNDNDFEDSLDYGDIYSRLDGLLGLSRSNGYHVSVTAEGKTEFRLSALQVEILNVPLAPSDSTNARKFMADSTIKLEVPVSFGGQSLPPMSLKIKVQAGFVEKF